MLIVISNPVAIENEASLINHLFDKGLRVFHLRKPTAGKEEIISLLKEINPDHYSKIALHQHHEIAHTFGINRIHFTEAQRNKLTVWDYQNMEKENIVFSTSIHVLEEYSKLNAIFRYAFFGPLYESISKPGYKRKETTFSLPIKNTFTLLVALGGIQIENLNQTLQLGFDGVAVLGSIWNNEDPIHAFEKLNQLCQQSAHTY